MNISKEKITDFFNSRAHLWDEMCSHDEDMLSLVAMQCQIKAGDSVLDVACGTGVMTEKLLETSAGRIVGLDIAENMIAKAHEKFSDKRVCFKTGDIYDFDEEGWDVVLIYNAYPHLTDREKLVDNLKRLLREGGRFVIAHSPGADSINNAHADKPKDISLKLLSAQTEAKTFENDFEIDAIVDKKEIYIISGTS